MSPSSGASPEVQHRSVEEIGRSRGGPRPLPPLATQSSARHPPVIDALLDNGLRLIAVRLPSVPMVEVRLHVPLAGAGRHHAACAQLLAATLLRGTRSRTRDTLEADLARAGAQLETNVTPDRLGVHGRVLSEELPALLGVLADVLTGAALPDNDFSAEQASRIQNAGRVGSNPAVIAQEALHLHCYGDHAYAPRVPKAKDFELLEAEDVRALHLAGVVPRGSSLVLVGDLSSERVQEQVTATLGGWRGATRAHTSPVLPPMTDGGIGLVHHPGSVQSRIRLGAPALPRTDPGYAALQIANTLFGGYFSSRITENLRENKGYVYSVESGFQSSPGGCSLLIGMDVATENTASALLETLYELGRLSLGTVPTSEIEAARRYASGSLLTWMGSQAFLATSLFNLAGVGIEPDWLYGHHERLLDASRDEVEEAARHFFAPSAFTGVIVGDLGEIGPPLQRLGIVTPER